MRLNLSSTSVRDGIGRTVFVCKLQILAVTYNHPVVRIGAVFEREPGHLTHGCGVVITHLRQGPRTRSLHAPDARLRGGIGR
jgi:hypothetical protein